MDSSALDSSCLIFSPRNKFYICLSRSLLKRDIHLATPRYLSFPCSFLCEANVYWIHSWYQALCQVQEDRELCQSIGDRASQWWPVQSFVGVERKDPVSPLQKWGCHMEEELWQVALSVKSPLQALLACFCPTLGLVERLESISSTWPPGYATMKWGFWPFKSLQHLFSK